MEKDRLTGYDTKDIVAAKDDDFFSPDFDFSTTVLGINDFIADLDINSNTGAIVEQLAGANRQYNGLLRLFLSGIRQYDTADTCRFTLNSLDNDSIAQRF
jgi:hypothetical protein